jgi:hypothetical protein
MRGGNDPNKLIKLFAYSDASYINGNTRIGYCFFLNLESGTIYARSTKSNTVSHSSAESEIKAIDECVRLLTWMRGFLAELGYPQLEPTVIYVDNTAAITLAEKFNLSNNSAHLVNKLNYIHQEITNGNIKLLYINTENQIADILTKLLPTPQFLKLEDILLNGHYGNLPRVIDKEAEKHLLKKKYKYKKNKTLPPEVAISDSDSEDSAIDQQLSNESSQKSTKVSFAKTIDIYEY